MWNKEFLRVLLFNDFNEEKRREKAMEVFFFADKIYGQLSDVST